MRYINMLRLDKKSFFQTIQLVLDEYLKPLNDEAKLKLRDGYIERPIHGAMHASRTVIWALIMHGFLQKIIPEYVQDSMGKISRFIGCDAEQALLIILITMACHDVARKGEGKDLWEQESAEYCQKFLMDRIKAPQHVAVLFSKAIHYKDVRNSYIDELEKLDIVREELIYFNYIANLINLGDNLDLMRCVENFKLPFIFNTLLCMRGFDKSLHYDRVMNIILAIHQFIYDQNDMLFPCTLLDEKENIVISRESHVSSREKVKFEHAENTFAAILHEATKIPEFQPFVRFFFEAPAGVLAAFTSGIRRMAYGVSPVLRKYEGQLVMNPLLHATNSSVFSTLQKSDLHFMSLLELMDDYQAVSLTGEVCKGGYDFLPSKTAKDSSTGKTAFARLMHADQDEDAYSLSRVVSEYTTLKIATKKGDRNAFRNLALHYGVSQAFSKIYLFTIYLARARYFHESLEEIISSDELRELRENLWATVQFYYFIQLLGTHIHPNGREAEKIDRQHGKTKGHAQRSMGFVANLMSVQLTFENLIKRIRKHQINMEDVFDRPTPANLWPVLKILELEPYQYQVFSLESNYGYHYGWHEEPYELEDKIQYRFHNLTKNIIFGIQDLLSKAVGDIAQNSMCRFVKQAADYIIALKDAIRIFEKIIQAPQEKFKLTDMQRYFLSDSFPLVVVTLAEEKMQVFSMNEYRSKQRLRLGDDIKIIATDTEEHRFIVMKFLALHGIYNVKVLLIKDLEQWAATKKEPSTPYHHHDGMLKLKWYCANKVSPAMFSDPTYAACLARYSQESQRDAEQLVGVADKYRAIKF